MLLKVQLTMKKLAILCAAFCAAFSFSSCDNAVEESINDNKEIKIDVTVGNPGEETTRAIKNGWVAGDKINVWLDEIKDYAATPDIILTYDGTNWNASSLSKTPNATGKFLALYEGYNDWVNKYTHSSEYQYCVNKSQAGGYIWYYAVPMTIYDHTSTYSYNGETLTANLNKWEYITTIQVVVTGLDGDPLNYALSCDQFHNVGAVYLKKSKTGIENPDNFSHSNYSRGGAAVGVPNADGVAFYFAMDSGVEDKTFTLYDNNAGTSKTYSVSKSLSYSWTKCVGIKIPASKFE